MSKSRGTGVFLNTDANTMFGQIMAQPDEMIRIFLINNTRIPLVEIDALDIENNPMNAKLFTAHKIVEIFHGTMAANSALEHFKNTFSNKVFPENAPEFATDKPELSVMDILQIGMPTESKTELRRLVLQNAVTINNSKVTEPNQIISTSKTLFVRVGRKTFFKIVKK